MFRLGTGNWRELEALCIDDEALYGVHAEVHTVCLPYDKGVFSIYKNAGTKKIQSIDQSINQSISQSVRQSVS